MTLDVGGFSSPVVVTDLAVVILPFVTRGRAQITVVLTTHESERYLPLQLTSILSQDRLPDLVVVADDHSTDATLQTVQDAVRRSSVPLTLIAHTAHVGLQANMEAGLRACPPGIIVLADHDDIWEPHKLTVVEKAFSAPEVTLWFSDAELIDDDGQELGYSAFQSVHFDLNAQRSVLEGRGIERLIYGMTVVGATVAFRSELLDFALPLPSQLEGVDHLYLHDAWLSVLASVVGDVRFTTEKLVRYRQHADQVTSMSLLAAARESSPEARQPDLDDWARERDRLTLIVDRVREVGPRTEQSAKSLGRAAARRAFIVSRISIRDATGSTPLRFGAMVRHLVNGDYGRFSNGALSAGKDLRRILTTRQRPLASSKLSRLP